MSARRPVPPVLRRSAAGEVALRPLANGDLEQVIAIERRVFPAPWSLGMFLLELSRRDTLALGAFRERRLYGYLVCSRYAGDWHLMTLAVDPRLQRRGLGRVLLRELLGRLDDAHTVGAIAAPRVTLEVRRSNTAARRLYEAHGFIVCGVRPRYYPDNGEDALILWRTPATLRGETGDVPGADR